MASKKQSNGIQTIWLADYTTKEHQGGAQQTNQVMVDYGISLGHRIEYMTPLKFSVDKLKKSDLVIINNIMKFSPYQINWIIENVPYIRYEHDYDVAKLIKNFPNIYKKSKLNIFLSPLHKQETESLIGEKIKSEIIPSPIKDFYSKNDKREGILWVGNIVSEKGLSNVIRYMKNNPNKMLKVIGFGDCDLAKELKSLKNVKFIGEIKHSNMINEYNKAEAFIHLPLWKEPFGRTIAEAYLCGCDLIVNNNCGAMSYNWDWNNYDLIKQTLNNSSEVFWDIIKKYAS
jgi:glycosyltransferase involved in cell wall biosynthesis